jgi:DNA-binding response OmpR family regulator
MGALGTTLRVFVVEDETMISMALEDTIEMLGYQIIGPVAQLDEALILATNGDFDCAILDVNIRGGKSYAVADLLLKRGCPFFLTTGYSDWSLPKHLTGQKRLTKPYSTSELEIQLRGLFSQVEESRQNGPCSES